MSVFESDNLGLDAESYQGLQGLCESVSKQAYQLAVEAPGLFDSDRAVPVFVRNRDNQFEDSGRRAIVIREGVDRKPVYATGALSPQRRNGVRALWHEWRLAVDSDGELIGFRQYKNQVTGEAEDPWHVARKGPSALLLAVNPAEINDEFAAAICADLQAVRDGQSVGVLSGHEG